MPEKDYQEMRVREDVKKRVFKAKERIAKIKKHKVAKKSRRINSKRK